MPQLYSHANTGSNISIRLQPPTPAPHHLLAVPSQLVLEPHIKLYQIMDSQWKQACMKRGKALFSTWSSSLAVLIAQPHRQWWQLVTRTCQGRRAWSWPCDWGMWRRNQTLCLIPTFLRLHWASPGWKQDSSALVCWKSGEHLCTAACCSLMRCFTHLPLVNAD